MGRIEFDLFSASNTIYHRAAMGGLAGTIEFWNANGGIEGITATYDDSTITIDFDDEHFNRVGLDKLYDCIGANDNQEIKDILDNIIEEQNKLAQLEKLKNSSEIESDLVENKINELSKKIKIKQKHINKFFIKSKLSIDIINEQHRICWAFIQTVFENSFKVKDGLLNIVGQLISNDLDRIATHNCICGTFIQNAAHKTWDKTKNNYLVNFRKVDDELSNNCLPIGCYLFSSFLSYNFLDQNALDHVEIKQYVVPGLTSGACCYFTDWQEAFLLKFLVAGCFFYSIRGDNSDSYDNCFVIPSIINLENFVISMEACSRNNDIFNKYEPSLSDVVLWLDLQLNLNDFFKQNVEAEIVNGLTVITMGNVAWDKSQKNIKSVCHVDSEFDDIELYKKSRQILTKKIIKYSTKEKKTSYMVVFENNFCSFVAKNIVNKKHWNSSLKEYIGQKKKNSSFTVFDCILRDTKQRMELAEMVQFASDDDKMVIDIATKLLAKHFANWRKNNFDFIKRINKLHYDIIRHSKTMGQLRQWFLEQFCKESFGVLAEYKCQFHQYIYNDKNLNNFESNLLYAILSYTPKSSLSNHNDDSEVDENKLEEDGKENDENDNEDENEEGGEEDEL